MTDEVNKRNYDTQQRRDMADKGEALPDGSFPIADKVDLGNALQSIGRAANRTIAIAHIRRRAKALDAEDMLPDWAMAKSTVSPLSIALGVLLADSYSVYHEAHGFHWNVKGADFSQYHDLFSSITDDIYESIDPIAENMLKINADAPFRMSELASMRTVPESSPASDPQSMATALLAQIDGLLNTLKRTFDSAIAQNEQGIANFLSERIDATQKWAWQLRASAGVQKADILALERLRPFVDASEHHWNLMVDEVVKAGSIRQTTGYTAGILAKAAKQSFGGNRSAAGQYAARVRWGSRGGSSSAAGPKSSPASAGGAMDLKGNDSRQALASARGAATDAIKAHKDMESGTKSVLSDKKLPAANKIHSTMERNLEGARAALILAESHRVSNPAKAAEFIGRAKERISVVSHGVTALKKLYPTQWRGSLTNHELNGLIDNVLSEIKFLEEPRG